MAWRSADGLTFGLAAAAVVSPHRWRAGSAVAPVLVAAIVVSTLGAVVA